MPGRFDYIAYDQQAQNDQAAFKAACQQLEENMAALLKPGRWQSLAFTKLEEFYMCVGKQIRDDQIARNGSAELQEGRKDS